jgi:predicted Zn-dependent peptidase
VEETARRWLEQRQPGLAPAGPPPQSKPGVQTAARDLEQLHLVLARPGPSALADDRFAARLFAEIFGGGMASRLFQQVREERGLAYTIDASCDQYSDAGRISVYAGCAPEDAAEIVAITNAIWADMANGPTDAELARAKAVMKASFAMAAEAPAARAGSAAYELLSFDRLIDMPEVLARIDTVTVADVGRIAAEALAGPPTAAAVGPKAGLDAAEAFAGL